MRKVLFLGFSLLSIFTMNSQCLENVDGFGNNSNIPMYNISGTVDVTLNTDGTVTLDLASDFMTAAGPDIRAFLVNSGGLTDQQLTNTLIADLQNVQFGLVGSGTVNQNGAKSFTIDIPAGNNIQDFDKIFFYCLQFDQFWDFGTFTPFSDTTCDILSVEDENLNKIGLYPNPAQGEVEIVSDGINSVTAKVFTMQGTQVLDNIAVNGNLRLDISALTTGVYLVQFTTQEGNSNVQKLVIR